LNWHKRDIMLLLDQTLSSLEKQWVLAQATQVGNDYHLQWAPILVAPKNEGINVPIHIYYIQEHRQSPWQIHTKGAVECRFADIKSWVQVLVQPKEKEKIFGDEDIAQWESVCPACESPWVQFPSIAKSKKW
jgi:hypothetical protein